MTTIFDDIRIETLRESGSLKWTRFPGKIGAFIAEMDFGTAPPISRALHAAIELGTFGYLPPALSDRMSEACAQWLRNAYGWHVPAANVRPVADVVIALMSTIEHFSVPGSPVILPTPAYMPFLTVPATLGREVIQVPMVPVDGRLSYDLAALDAAFRAGGHLLVVCNPHNPIGRVLTRTELTAVAEVVQRHGGRVFADEIHAPLVFPGHRHVPYASISASAATHAVTATSASKAWNLPGMKCAQIIFSNEADLETWARVGTFTEHGAANLGVIAAATAYADGRPWLDELLGYLDHNRILLAELLAERIPEIGYTPPEGTYLAWLDCRGLGLGDQPSEFFLDRAGVALTDGTLCGVAGKGFARYNFATPRPIMEQAITQLARALAAR